MIISEICKYYRTDEKTIRGKQRDRDAVRARQVAMYLIRKIGNISLSDIGKEFGGRDHSTVIHSIEQVDQRIEQDAAFAATIRDITSNINSKH